MKVPLSPCPHQYLLILFLIIDIAMGVNIYLLVVLVFRSLMAKKDILYKRKKRRLSLSRDEVVIKSLMSQFQTGSQYELIFILFLFSSASLSILCRLSHGHCIKASLL